MDYSSFAFESAKTALSFLWRYWWTYLPFVLGVTAIQLWQTYTRTRYIKSINWVLLEVKPPPEVPQGPKIAESIFAGLHGIYGVPVKWKKKFFEGKVPDWFSFEIVSNAGDMKFYIRCPEGLRNLVEAQIFGQYPNAEITVAEDYVGLLPGQLPDDEYDLFGAELIFTKDNAYPIKTYPFFEEAGGKDEYRYIDPLASLAEVMTGIGPGEHLWLQLLVRPTGGDWVKEAQKIVDKLVGKEPKAERDWMQKTFDAIDSLIPSGAAAEKKEEKKEEFNVQRLTPGQRFALEQVENKMAKLGFKAGHRFLYIGKKDVFNRARVSAVTGMFKQLYFNNLNSFKPNGEVSTFSAGWLAWLFPSGDGLFKAQQEYRRKFDIYQSYRIRSFVDKYVILNTEELATLFHLPGLNVRAPFLPRVEAKKGQPPAGLPTG